MFIIAGLGNPGDKYQGTRHNAGFWFIDRLAERLGVKANKLKFKSLCASAQLGGEKVLIMKPMTYMNLSGEAIYDAAQYYKVPPCNILVVYDDIAIPFLSLRIRAKGSDGGHNGMKSIIYMLQSDDFPRIRLGMGAPDVPGYDLADWVLGSIPKDAHEGVMDLLDRAVDAAEMIVKGDISGAMSRYNTKKEKKKPGAADAGEGCTSGDGPNV